MGIMGQYSLQEDVFVIEDYDKLPAFSSFLPGLVGVRGIPMWVFYTNRGQGIGSFGIHNKNNAIAEFNPANTSYENTALKGFRTFMKVDGSYFEPFLTCDGKTERKLYIRKNSLGLEEHNTERGIKIRVSYYGLPQDSVGALVRKVEIENLSQEAKQIEVLDGMPKIIPYGIKNSEFKEMSNLLQSWTDIKNLENSIPFYTLRASSEDSAEVSAIEGGYFYLSVQNQRIMPVIYDRDVVFGYDTSLLWPLGFLQEGLSGLLSKEQCFANKIPCGFTPYEFRLQPEETFRFDTLIGFAGSVEQINEKARDFCSEGYLQEKERTADRIVQELTQDIRTHTAVPAFDQYVEQCYLDNFLRGGYPFLFNKDRNPAVIHLFSRKHGDPERDYNFFTIAGEYYSQGNGNFRDVCQNRRNDVFFNKDVGDFNIKTFFSLIQIDGYNPLEVRPSTFSVKPDCKEEAKSLLKASFPGKEGRLSKIIERPFTPGQIANYIAGEKPQSQGMSQDLGMPQNPGMEDTFLTELLALCDQNIEAGFGEGYWSDHWDYVLDLIENYLKIYPDRERELLFGDRGYRYYDSPALVVHRSEKYVIQKGEVRQYGALVTDEEKLKCSGFKKGGSNWLNTKSGEEAKANLMEKLISLGLNKFALLDSYGMGVEMEGGKPGWNDAMNGLPGLFGSSMAEAFELKRLLAFIIEGLQLQDNLELPVEIHEFLFGVYENLKAAEAEGWSDFTYWDRTSSLREKYRDRVRFFLEGERKEVSTQEVQEVFLAFLKKLDKGIQRAGEYAEGIIPTYFTFRASEFEEVKDEAGQPVLSHYGLPKARVKAFQVQTVPAFLEGPARMLRTKPDFKEAEKLCRLVRDSGLYDKKLKMYKTSVPIEELSMEYGRIRAFTPGWLERESIFLHMEYKYLLAMLKAGMYELFFEDIGNALIPFLRPEIYGRSILENSSFLASSANPDSKTHGRGYVARLSGSTVEVLSMWMEMFVGGRIFTYDTEKKELQLHFEPLLPGWMFDERGEVSFYLLSHCLVTYGNAGHKATYGSEAAKITGIRIPERELEIKGNTLTGSLAEEVRDGKITALLVTME